RNPDGTVTGDITHYVYWTRLVTLGGIQSAYGGTWPETYAVYPPVTLYADQAVGNVYRWLQDPAFDPLLAQSSQWLHAALKFVALTWHLLTALAILLIVRRTTHAPMLAAVAGALYVANPAALFDVAHWAQPDGAHSLFSVLAVGLLSVGQVVVPWAALGALTYRTVAGGLVGAVLLLSYWLFWTRRASLAEAAALGVLGWFTFTTQAHENHLFFALPVLSLAWPTRRWLLVPFGTITLTLLANMWLHDELLLEALGSGLVDP